MRFIVDECTGPAVAEWLRGLSHEVFSIFEEAKGAEDATILHKAVSESWILITNDKDFGEMIFRNRWEHRGVIFLRLADERPANKIAVLEALLQNHSERLANTFVTATESKARFV